MSTNAEIILPWAGVNHKFALKLPEIDEFQRITASIVVKGFASVGNLMAAQAIVSSCGLGAIWQRLISGNFIRTDVTEAIRLGLIGGGKSSIEAQTLVEAHVYNKPFASVADIAALHMNQLPSERQDAASNLAVAIAIVSAAFFGVEELQPVGKAKGRRRTRRGTSTSQTTTSNGEPSKKPPPT